MRIDVYEMKTCAGCKQTSRYRLRNLIPAEMEAAIEAITNRIEEEWFGEFCPKCSEEHDDTRIKE